MLVRLPVDYQIKPHAPPLNQTPAILFNFTPFGSTFQVKYFIVKVTYLKFIVYSMINWVLHQLISHIFTTSTTKKHYQ